MESPQAESLRRFHFAGRSLRKARHRHEYIGYLVPGRKVHAAGLGQMEDLLKLRHCRLGGGAVDPVRRNFGDGGVVVRDAVELVLDGPHVLYL